MASDDAEVLPQFADVLVVGFGPVGAALSVLLGRQGVRAVVIDRADDVLLMPRAIALDNEALRILQMVGLDESAFERITIPHVRMHCPFTGEFARVNTTGSIDGHPKLVTFYQPDLEHALRRQVEQSSCVQFFGGHELTDLVQNDSGVSATVKDREGVTREIRARYLVGADGASSRVRSLIGLDFEGETYAEDWLIVDAARREGKAISHVEFICDPSRPTPHMPAPGGRERWEFMLSPGEKREQMESAETVAGLLAPWIAPEDLVVERKAVYRFHARCCKRFQERRVFLVGDAAHITPPFVGQGLVAGLRDAANLGWKLAWVVSARAEEGILDSYDEERRPHARKMIGLAKLMGRLVMPRSRTSAIAIHGVMRAVRLVPPARDFLEELKVKPANRFRRGLFAKGKGVLLRGAQLPQQSIIFQGKECLSDDALGDKLTLVGFGVDPASAIGPGVLANWQAAGGSCLQIGRQGRQSASGTPFAEDLTGELTRATRHGWVAIVRPDRVVMHDGPPAKADKIVSACLRMLAV